MSTPPLDPQAQAVIDAFARMNLPAPETVPIAQARRQFMDARRQFLAPEEAVGAVENCTFVTSAGPLPVRIYRPNATSDTPMPALVYFHGGGWVFGNLDSHDRLCRSLCNQSGHVVISVDYRLAPEHKFPAAFDDAVASLRYVEAHAGELGIDPKRIAAGGDSAGGSIVAAAAIEMRDRGGPALTLQVLLYPVTDLRMNSDSYRRLGTGYMLTAQRMKFFADHYLRSAQDALDWRASPLLAKDLSRLPPALVITASHDPLVDEGEAYAKRMRGASVEVEYECVPGVIHGFATMAGAIGRGATVISRVSAAMR